MSDRPETTIDASPRLARGKHGDIRDGACLLEAASDLAGEPFSAYPECVSPVISTFLRPWNDALNDNDRDVLLRPLIPALIGTRSTKEVEHRRAMLAADWLVRVHTPAWLRLAGLNEHADALAGLPEIVGALHVIDVGATVAAATAAAQHERKMSNCASNPVNTQDSWLPSRRAVDATNCQGAQETAWIGVNSFTWGIAANASYAAAEVAAHADPRDICGSVQSELHQAALALVHRMIGMRLERTQLTDGPKQEFQVRRIEAAVSSSTMNMPTAWASGWRCKNNGYRAMSL